MDQDSFRKLIATPRLALTGSTSSSSKSWQKPHGGSESQSTKPAFKPRSERRNNKGKGNDRINGEAKATIYRDRASDRRAGRDNEFSEVEKMLEDFNTRTSNVEDRALIEEQRKYLGGDASHSIAVKGLDLALLVAEKAKIAQEDGANAEDDLEQAFLGRGPLEFAPSPPAEKVQPKKRTRDDLLKELREKNVSHSVYNDEDSLAKAKVEGKFKRVGDTAVEPEKKKRRKKKPKPDHAALEPIVSQPLHTNQRKMSPIHSPITGAPIIPESVSESMPPPSVPASEPPPRPEDDDSDFELFAGVGGYDLGGDDISDSDSDTDRLSKKNSSRPTQPQPVTSAPNAVRPRYFDDEEEIRADPITAPVLPKFAPPQVLQNSKQRRSEHQDDDRPRRLEGLCSSTLTDIRALLDRDAAEAKEEARRERKLQHRKGVVDDGEAPKRKKKELSAAEKANRDYQEYETFQRKRQNAVGHDDGD